MAVQERLLSTSKLDPISCGIEVLVAPNDPITDQKCFPGVYYGREGQLPPVEDFLDPNKRVFIELESDRIVEIKVCLDGKHPHHLSPWDVGLLEASPEGNITSAGGGHWGHHYGDGERLRVGSHMYEAAGYIGYCGEYIKSILVVANTAMQRLPGEVPVDIMARFNNVPGSSDLIRTDAEKDVWRLLHGDNK